MSDPKRWGTQEKPSPIEMTYMVRVTSDEDKEASIASHLTAKIDLFARTKEGLKIFESFHIITVPTGEFSGQVVLRKQLRESLKIDLERLVRSLSDYN